jgi:hypothetical protein
MDDRIFQRQAIPHGTLEGKGAVRRDALAVVRFPETVDWDGNQVTRSSPAHNKEALGLIESGAGPVDDLITHRFAAGQNARCL